MTPQQREAKALSALHLGATVSWIVSQIGLSAQDVRRLGMAHGISLERRG
jgi:hypothetical protein